MAKGKKKKHKAPKLQHKYLAKAKKLKESGKTRMHVLKKAWELQIAAKGHGGKKKKGKTGAHKGKRHAKKKGGHRSRAAEPKSSKKKGGGKGKKGGKKSKKRGPRGVESLSTAINRDKTRLANLRADYETKLSKYRTRLATAEGAERERLEKAISRLKQQLTEAIARHEEREKAFREKLAMAQAAEKSRKSGKGKKKKRKSNPIDGGGEGFAAAAGAGLGGVLTVVQYRAIVSHPLTPTNPAGVAAPSGSFGYDTPNVGDVPNLLTPSLPVWSKFKWRKLIALLAYLGIDVGVPFAAVMWVPAEHRKTRTFFQAMLIADLTLGGTKFLIDVAAFALKGTKIGNRLFAPENTARSSRAFSAQQQSPQTFLVAPGAANGTLAGYGKALTQGTREVGAGCCKSCGKPQMATGGCGCSKGTPQNYMPPTTPPVAHVTPPSPAPATNVPGTAPSRSGAGEAAREPVGASGAHVGAAVDMSNVTPIGARQHGRTGAGHTTMRRAFGRR